MTLRGYVEEGISAMGIYEDVELKIYFLVLPGGERIRLAFRGTSRDTTRRCVFWNSRNRGTNVIFSFEPILNTFASFFRIV